MMNQNDIASTNIKPWEQLPAETNKAYDRFIIYLELGPERSIPKAREMLGKSSGYDRHLESWSSKYNWVDRANAYDNFQLTKRMKHREEARELGRQIMVDNVEESARKLVDIALGRKPAKKDQVSSILGVLDRAGVTPIKNIDSKDIPDSSNLYQQINYFYQQDE